LTGTKTERRQEMKNGAKSGRIGSQLDHNEAQLGVV
jgi:hypothetical protein